MGRLKAEQHAEELIKRASEEEARWKAEHRAMEKLRLRKEALRQETERASQESARLNTLLSSETKRLREEARRLREEKDMRKEAEELAADALRKLQEEHESTLKKQSIGDKAWLAEQKRVLDLRKKEMDHQENAAYHAKAEALRLKNEKDAENAQLKAMVEELKLEKQMLEDNLVKKVRHDNELAEQLAKERAEDEAAAEALRIQAENDRLSRLQAESEVLEKVAILMAQVQVVGEPLSPGRVTSGVSAPPPTPSTPPKNMKERVAPLNKPLTEEEEAIALAARLRQGNAALQNSARYKVEKAIAPLRMSSLLPSDSDDDIYDDI